MDDGKDLNVGLVRGINMKLIYEHISGFYDSLYILRS